MIEATDTIEATLDAMRGEVTIHLRDHGTIILPTKEAARLAGKLVMLMRPIPLLAELEPLYFSVWPTTNTN